jgi:hypothetical protein
MAGSVSTRPRQEPDFRYSGHLQLSVVGILVLRSRCGGLTVEGAIVKVGSIYKTGQPHGVTQRHRPGLDPGRRTWRLSRPHPAGPEMAVDLA